MFSKCVGGNRLQSSVKISRTRSKAALLRTVSEETCAAISLDSLHCSKFLNFRFDIEGSQEFLGLVDSIRQHGLLNPLIVRPSSDQSNFKANPGFEIVCGHRRYLACQSLSLKSVPCRILELNNQRAMEIALMENVQRESLNPIEEAEGFKSYVLSFGRGSIRSLARKIGKSDEYISHRLRILGLPEQVLEKVSKNILKPSEAQELVWLNDSGKQIELANRIVEQKLTFRQTRKALRAMRQTGASVDEAVEFATKKPKSPIEEGTRTQEFLESWGSYGTVHRSRQVEILKRAILTLRACLAGLDLLFEESNVSEVREVLLNQRQVVHTALDEIVKVKTEVSRELS